MRLAEDLCSMGCSAAPQAPQTVRKRGCSAITRVTFDTRPSLANAWSSSLRTSASSVSKLGICADMTRSGIIGSPCRALLNELAGVQVELAGRRKAASAQLGEIVLGKSAQCRVGRLNRHAQQGQEGVVQLVGLGERTSIPSCAVVRAHECECCTLHLTQATLAPLQNCGMTGEFEAPCLRCLPPQRRSARRCAQSSPWLLARGLRCAAPRSPASARH